MNVKLKGNNKKNPGTTWLLLITISALIYLAFPGHTEAAITFDSSNTRTGTANSIDTWSHTVSGSNPILIVGVSVKGASSTGVNSITFNGDSLTKLASDANGTKVAVELWYLVNPDVDTHTISMDMTGGSGNNYTAGSMSFVGVDQATPLGTHATASSGSNTATVNVSSAAGELVIDVVGTEKESISIGSGQTQRFNPGADPECGGSSEPGASSVTMSWSINKNNSWAIIAVPLKPAPDAMVSTTGSQTSSMVISSINQYVGGKFVIRDYSGSRNVTGITITEHGTVDALNDLDNIKLYYDLDTSAPYDCASESYGGGESQFGSTDTTGFSSANGTSVFTDSVGISTTSTMCVYVVLDVGSGASNGEDLEIKIDDPSTDVTVSSGTRGPSTSVEIAGTTTLVATPCSGTFSYRRLLTIDKDRVGVDNNPGSLSDFPALISLSGDWLKSVSNGGNIYKSDGWDIIFRESDGRTHLDHEIEKYDGNTGTIVAWVRIPSLAKDIDTQIYMYYGNCDIPAATENPTAVWSNGYKGVWHLKETPTVDSQAYDSISSPNNGMFEASMTSGDQQSGQIDGSIDFDGTDDYVEVPHIDNYLLDNGTVSFWFMANNVTTNQGLFSKDSESFDTGGHILLNIETDSTIRARLQSTAATTEIYSSAITSSTWYLLTFSFGSGGMKLYLNDGTPVTDTYTGGLGTTSGGTGNFEPIALGANSSLSDDLVVTPVQDFLSGQIDEVRISSVERDADWINTSYNNQNDPTKDAACTDNGFICVGSQEADPPTAVSLISFSAQGQGPAVTVEWQTAREFDNLGFHLYRATSPAGPYKRLTEKLISATVKPGKGGTYSYVDSQVTVGTLYYYELEDIDIYSIHTQHGPICVDWDADGMPDGWEIIHGLNPWVNDADLDYDGDGLSNFEEYERGLDPFNPDTDGDGIPDGEEDGRLPARDDPGSRAISRGVEVLEADDSGMTLVLNTSGFEAEVISVCNAEYEQLNIADYVHGYTAQTGAPQLPHKGLLIDVPAGKAAQLTVVDSQVEPYSGYRIYPVPEAVLDAAGGMAAVGGVFYQDELAYSNDGFYPDAVAQLGQSYVFRDQVKQQVIFYPIGFNPVSGQLNLYRRIELRIDFVEAAYAKAAPMGQMPWQPTTSPGVLSPIAVGLAAAPALVNPISPLLSSLGTAISALWSPPDDAEGNVYKIITDAEGIHQISKDYLDTNGVDTAAIRLSWLRLYYLGAEVAIEVVDQNSDDRMDAADYIRFYAQPVSSLYAKYSDQNVYWLTLSGGSGAPLRMSRIAAGPAGGPLAVDFADSARHELDQVIWLKAPGEDSVERWFFWTYVQGTEHAGGGLPKAFTITVPDPISSGTLTILMAGQTETTHEVRVAINGVQQDFSWTGISYYQATVNNVPLVDGDNTVTLQCLSADGNDSIIVDWFEIDYWRDYVAVDNKLRFAPDSGNRYAIDGFSSNSLLAYDISDPAAVAKIDNAVITGSDPYSIEFEPADYGDTYLVLASDTVHIPVGLTSNTSGILADTANGADYILITHRDVGWDGSGDQRPWLANLIAHRQAQGLRVFVADIEDIYDTFSFGIKTPHAVKDFLAYAYANWTPPAARHVLLVGDSNYDPKNHWNENDTTAYLPTYMIYTDYKGETVTDQWFVTFSGEDAVADMHIGRLPAADAAQAAAMVTKIIDYETAINTQTWQTDLLLIADNQRPGSSYEYEAAFEAINEDAAALIPETMAEPFRGYLNDYAATAFLTDDIIDAINDGMLIANYAGHGATQVMAEEHIFDAADVAALTNTDRLAFFVSMSCETGFFAYPETWFYPSLAEVLLRSDAGAVAALMPTGMTTTDSQQILDAALFETIFTKDIRTLGPAIAEAKQTLLANGDAYSEQIANTFLLFGDPATKLKVPLPHIPTWIDAKRQDGGAHLSWNGASDCNGNAVAGYNLYRANSATGPFNKINPQPITDTVFVDTDIGVSMAATAGGSSNSYYKVSSVDDSGYESAQSLSISPAGLNTFSSGSGAGVGCFIGTTKSDYEWRGNNIKVSSMAIRCIVFSLLLWVCVSFGSKLKNKPKKQSL
jgi:hypothetical protein